MFSFAERLTECFLDNVGRAVTAILEQMPVNAERDRDCGITKAAADRHRVHSGGNDLTDMRMVQCVQRDAGKPEFGQGSSPFLGGAIRATGRAVPCCEHEVVTTGAAEGQPQPLLLLPPPVLI